MKFPTHDIHLFKHRRDRLKEFSEGSAFVISSHPECIRNSDVHYEYRQDSNFFYLTGFEEPESFFLFRPGLDPETILFVRPKDALRETWEGFRYGPAQAQKEFKMDKCYPIGELREQLLHLLKPVDKIYYKFGYNTSSDKIIMDIIEQIRISHGRSGMGAKPIYDYSEQLGEMRCIKTDIEIEWQKKACDISTQAHIKAMQITQPGINERQIQGTLIHAFMNELSPRPGYIPIVASGHNATTLHYIFNNQECRDGEILLIDAGAEWNYYSADITRSFPVNGKFTPSQKAFYEHVLYVQEELIKMSRPGLPFMMLQDKAIELLTEALIDLKILKGNKRDLIKNKHYIRYYPHSVSHFLGMDVHDVGLYRKNGESRIMEQGLVLTIEPGLYVRSDDDSAPEEFRGIGVRIEDDILITKTGHFNMTLRAPKTVQDIEDTMAQSRNEK